ncbi:MAG: hypothetical protein ISR65_05495 [Bacteriovoracaceae bacterium]|nr:hypothetical protein [Bacteriovoracaceae bacterium]
MNKVFTITLITIFSAIILNLNNIQNAKATTTTVKEEEEKRFSLLLISTLGSSLHKVTDVDHSLSNDFELSYKYKLPIDAKLGLYMAVSKNLMGEKKLTLNDASLSIAKVFTKFADFITFSGLAAAIIPLSENSRDNKKMLSKITIAPTFTFDMTKFITPGLSITYRPYGKVAFYRYEVALSGASNDQFTFGNRLIISYSFLKKFSISLDNIYSRSWTFSGDSKDGFSFDQSISYDVTDAFGMALGHYNSGSALASDGVESAVKFINPRTSTVYLSLSYAL